MPPKISIGERATLRARQLIVKISSEDYPGLSENEYHCLTIAGKLGLQVPDFWLSQDGKRLAIERFDYDIARDLYFGGRPTLLAPVVNPGLPVAFAWTPVQGAFIYQLQVDRLDIPQVRVVREENLLAATWQTPGALAVGTYRVWVRAVSTSGEFSNWSRSLDFLVTEVNPVESQLRPELVLLDRPARHSEAGPSTSSGTDRQILPT